MMGIWQRIVRRRTPEASQQTIKEDEPVRRYLDDVLDSPEDYVVISRYRLAVMEELIRRYRQAEDGAGMVPESASSAE